MVSYNLHDIHFHHFKNEKNHNMIRNTGLKILWAAMSVSVQVRSGALPEPVNY